MSAWFCTNCGFLTPTEPADPCPQCNCAIWERGLPEEPTDAK